MDNKRVYLHIPYESRSEAKESGAKWDPFKKMWYVDCDPIPKSLDKYRDSSHLERGDETFEEALNRIGFLLKAEPLVFDGQGHRLPTRGDGPGATSGFYVGFMNNGHPGGYAKNHRTGEEINWSEKNAKFFSKEEREFFKSQINKQREEAIKNEELLHIKTAGIVEYLLKSEFKPLFDRTPYHIKKHIVATADTFTDSSNNITAIPQYDISGKLWSLSYILEGGEKRYSKNGRKNGCFHVINGFDNLDTAPVLVIAEGFSTAATLYQALGFSTISAGDNTNLLAVARALRGKYPDKKIIIAGDDDRHVQRIHGYNPGKERAAEAAEAVGGKSVFPVFCKDEMILESKSFSDWNDLANKSKQGYDEFMRQVKEAFSYE